MNDTITLFKGGTLERTEKLSHVQIPDLYHLAQAMPDPHRKLILETWHLAHEMKKQAMRLLAERNALLVAAKAVVAACTPQASKTAVMAQLSAAIPQAESEAT